MSIERLKNMRVRDGKVRLERDVATNSLERQREQARGEIEQLRARKIEIDDRITEHRAVVDEINRILSLL